MPLPVATTGLAGCGTPGTWYSATTISRWAAENLGLQVVRVSRLSPKLLRTDTSDGETGYGVWATR